MKAAIFTIGNEILSGKTLNTNCYYLSRQLNSYGFEVTQHITAEDHQDNIVKIMHRLMKEVDLIVTTGGLGPTYDDLTIAAIAKSCNLEMILSQEIVEDIKEKFKRYGSKMTDNNLSQAYFPAGSIILPNKYGTAPGMILDYQGTIIISLPGPPRENIPMFDNQVIPELVDLDNGVVIIKDLVLFGVGESTAETILKDNIEISDELRIATYVKPRYVVVRLTSKNLTLINDYSNQIKNIFGENVIGEDGTVLENIIVEKMTELGRTLSLAESCTGGMIASHIVNVPGSSQVLNRSLVTYSNQAKKDELGVKEETLLLKGAVSEETAKEMAEGLYNKTHSDICLSVTGIAGPSGDTNSKEIGLTYIALKTKDSIQVYEYHFFGDRETIRHRATLQALNLIRLELLHE